MRLWICSFLMELGVMGMSKVKIFCDYKEPL